MEKMTETYENTIENVRNRNNLRMTRKTVKRIHIRKCVTKRTRSKTIAKKRMRLRKRTKRR